MENLNLVELKKEELQGVSGGEGFCIFCVRGLFDGVPKNTKFNWGCCQSQAQ